MVDVLQRSQREQEDLLARLRRIEGQVRGIQRMIEEGQDCEQIVTQLLAARGALDKVSLLIVSQQMERCLFDPTHPASREQLNRIVEFLLRFSTPSVEAEAIPEQAPDRPTGA